MAEQEDKEEEELEEESEVAEERSPVAVLKEKSTLGVIVIAVIAIGFLVKWAFFSGESNPDKGVNVANIPTKPKNSSNVNDFLPSVPSLPEPPKVSAPTPPPAPPQEKPKLVAPPPPPVEHKKAAPSPAPKPAPASSPAPAPTSLAPAPAAVIHSKHVSGVEKMNRSKSGLLVGGHGSGGSTTKAAPMTNNFTPQKTSAAQVQATKVGNMRYTIAQGHVIDAILETALNTDFPGMVRAIVSRDVYAESGNLVMIPRGSRLIGKYGSGVTQGQTRIAIVWDRIIMPDGLDIMVDSPATDQIGRAGVNGLVDNKYFEIIANAMLSSTFNIAFSYAADNMLGTAAQYSQVQSTGTAGTSTVTSGNNVGTALQNANQTVSNAIQQVTKNSLNIHPTITVNQGTKIKVFVQRDLLFPENLFTRGVLGN